MSYAAALHLVPNQIRSHMNTVPTRAVAWTRAKTKGGGGWHQHTEGQEDNGLTGSRAETRPWLRKGWGGGGRYVRRAYTADVGRPPTASWQFHSGRRDSGARRSHCPSGECITRFVIGRARRGPVPTPPPPRRQVHKTYAAVPSEASNRAYLRRTPPPPRRQVHKTYAAVPSEASNRAYLRRTPRAPPPHTHAHTCGGCKSSKAPSEAGARTGTGGKKELVRPTRWLERPPPPPPRYPKRHIWYKLQNRAQECTEIISCNVKQQQQRQHQQQQQQQQQQQLCCLLAPCQSRKRCRKRASPPV